MTPTAHTAHFSSADPTVKLLVWVRSLLRAVDERVLVFGPEVLDSQIHQLNPDLAVIRTHIAEWLNRPSVEPYWGSLHLRAAKD